MHRLSQPSTLVVQKVSCYIYLQVSNEGKDLHLTWEIAISITIPRVCLHRVYLFRHFVHTVPCLKCFLQRVSDQHYTMNVIIMLIVNLQLSLFQLNLTTKRLLSYPRLTIIGRNGIEPLLDAYKTPFLAIERTPNKLYMYYNILYFICQVLFNLLQNFLLLFRIHSLQSLLRLVLLYLHFHV